MDGGGPRENGRHKQDHYRALHDQYRGVHTQWLIPAHLMKDHHGLSVRFMTILSERDAALQERDLALSERKVALVERDMALMQRDAALAERNNALIERDQVIAAFEYRENATMSVSSSPPERLCPPSNEHGEHQHQPCLSEAAFLAREIHFAEALPIPGPEITKPVRNKRPKLNKPAFFKRTPKSAKSSGCGEDLNKDVVASPKEEWKDQDLGLNQVIFDDSSMPVPVCSCTGSLQQCYKWGNGGWQSACCTNTMSIYPLPMIPNKRHARVSGRKMSGSAFTKLLSRLAIEGYDLSSPLDLKDHWAKHGTNRYITIK
ncbi:hypothetical protein ACHQM5_015617 [Ranunculus cassubicifolius]